MKNHEPNVPSRLGSLASYVFYPVTYAYSFMPSLRSSTAPLVAKENKPVEEPKNESNPPLASLDNNNTSNQPVRELKPAESDKGEDKKIDNVLKINNEPKEEIKLDAPASSSPKQKQSDWEKLNLEQIYSRSKSNLEVYKEVINAILKKRDILNEKTANGDSLLHLVIIGKKPIEIIDFLVEKGFSLDVRNGFGETPLFSGIRTGNVSAVKRLLELKNTLIQSTMLDGTGLLHYSVLHKQTRMYEWFLSEYSNTAILINQGYSALCEAIKQRDEKAIQALLNAGIPLCSAEFKYSVLHDLVERQDGELIKKIYEMAKLEVTKVLDFKFNKKTVLACTLEKNNLPMVEFFITKGASLCNLNDSNQNAFHVATKNIVSEKIFDCLTQSKEYQIYLLNTKDDKGLAPVHIATKEGNAEALKWLLSKNANFSTSTSQHADNQTALHLAIANIQSNVTTTQRNVVSTLCKNGEISFWSKNKVDKTPLQLLRKDKTHKEIKMEIQSNALAYFVTRLADNISSKINASLFDKIKTVNFMAINILGELLSQILNDKRTREIRNWILYEINEIELERAIIFLSEHFVTEIINTLGGSAHKSRLKAYKKEFKENKCTQFKQLLSDTLISGKQAYLSRQLQQDISVIDTRFSYTVQFTKEALFRLKRKAFQTALMEALRYIFYMNLAIVDGKVEPKDGAIANVQTLINAAAPIVRENMQDINTPYFNINGKLLFSLADMFMRAMVVWETKKAKEKAQLILDAFQICHGKINIQLIGKIAEAFYQRFRDQIHQMSLSISTTGDEDNVHMNEQDGIVQFAEAIIKRINSHILAGLDLVGNESGIKIVRGINKAKDKAIHFTGSLIFQTQDMKAVPNLPTEERCLMATWKQIDDMNAVIKCDARTGIGKKREWLAHDILSQTGIKIVDANGNETSYIRKNCFKPEVGFIYATLPEANMRGYKLLSTKSVQDEQRVSRTSIDNNANSVSLKSEEAERSISKNI